MSLRCLLFSSKQETVPPIMQVLTELGMEGEHCASGVDAVEKVTTLLFEIVITDWDDQPEAAFLLKTVKDLKATQRPLTLAIVSDDASLPKALQAGANSVLVKPLRPEQVRDTLSTACQLLRAKQQTSAPKSATTASPWQPAPAPSNEAAEFAVTSAPTAEDAVAAPASLPLSVTQMPEMAFRAGEFLQTRDSTPSAEFDTEKSEAQKSLDQAAPAEVDSLTDLEPTAAAVKETAADEQPAPPAEVREPLSGWAALQARLNKSAPPPPAEKPEKPATSELLSYGDVQSHAEQAPATANAAELPQSASVASEEQAESKSEIPAPDNTLEESEQAEPKSSSRRGKFVAAGVLAACVMLAIVPQTRQPLHRLGQTAIRAGKAWLNPPPPALPQTVAQHDNFSQAGDEYKLPTPTNIPDATTDPSQIRVVPVIDPTAKPDKNAANAAPADAAGAAGNPPDQTQSASAQGAPASANGGTGQSVASAPAADGTAPARVAANVPANTGPGSSTRGAGLCTATSKS